MLTFVVQPDHKWKSCIAGRVSELYYILGLITKSFMSFLLRWKFNLHLLVRTYFFALQPTFYFHLSVQTHPNSISITHEKSPQADQAQIWKSGSAFETMYPYLCFWPPNQCCTSVWFILQGPNHSIPNWKKQSFLNIRRISQSVRKTREEEIKGGSRNGHFSSTVGLNWKSWSNLVNTETARHVLALDVISGSSRVDKSTPRHLAYHI